MKQIKTIRGIRDILYPESGKWDKIISIADGIFLSYGYRKIYLPVIEYSELFSRSIGEDTDIVAKEMYSFKDKKGRDLSLRPEGTAGVVRAMIENNLLQGQIREKIYYFGPMFRYERPQEGRYRQFYQLGCEVFGSSSPMLDVEITEIALNIIDACQIEKFNLNINSVGCEKCRGVYRNEIKKYLLGKEDTLCNDCKRRINTNTLRILDCKNEKCMAIYSELPVFKDYLCDGCDEFFDDYKKFLDERKINYNHDKYLVRGLDYYTGPVFEIDTAADVIVAGGRYDNLVSGLGGPSVSACGWAMGLDRMVRLCGIEAKNIPDVYIAMLSGGNINECRKIAVDLRKNGFSVEEDYEDIPCGKKFKLADKKSIMWVVIMGEEEATKGLISLKNLKTGEQKNMPLCELINFINTFG